MKINGLIVKDKYGNELNIGDRVSFDNKLCRGYGELGTITKIEKNYCWNKKTGKYDLEWGDEDNFCLWVRWDCHGQEVGECFDLRVGSREWKFKERGTKQITLI